MSDNTHADSEVLNVIRSKEAIKLRDILIRRGLMPKIDRGALPQKAVAEMKQIDLRALFGVGKACSCFFHNDKAPSVSLLRAGSGDWLYYCHAKTCTCGGRALNLMQLVAELQKVSLVQAYHYLCEVMGYHRKNSAGPNVGKLLEENIGVVTGERLKEIAPTASKIIKMDMLKTLYEFGRDSLNQSGIDGEGSSVVFSMSNNQFRKAYEHNVKQVSNFLAQLAYLGVIKRVPLYELSTRRYGDVMHYLMKNKGHLPTNQIEVFPLTDGQLREIENRAIQWKKQRYSLSTFSYQTVYSKEGTFLAHELFPSGGQVAGCMEGNQQSIRTADFASDLKKAIDEIIDRSKGATLEEIRGSMRKKGYSRYQIKRSLKSELDALCLRGYQRVREGRKVLIIKSPADDIMFNSQ